MSLNPVIVQSFSWALIHFLWQGLVIGIVVYGLLKCLRKESCQKRYLVSAAGLTLLPVCFFYTFYLIYQEAQSSKVIPNIISDPSNMVNDPSFDASYFFFSWLAGVLYFTIRLATKVRVSHRLRFEKISLPKTAWQTAFNELLETLHLSKKIRLFESESIASPMVLGTLSPIVMVPLGFMCGLSPIEVKAILAHELAHIKRYDHLFNLFQECVETLFFFHPVTWILSSTIREEREYCSDELAVKLTGDPLVLAKSLTFMESCRNHTAHGLCANGGSLQSRIARLLNQEFITSQQINKPKIIMKNTKKVILCSTLFLSTVVGLSAINSTIENEDKTAVTDVYLISAKDIPTPPKWERIGNDVNDKSQIKVETKFIEITAGDPAVRALYNKYKSPENFDGESMKILTSVEIDDLETSLTRLKGADVMSIPTVISETGAPVSVSVLNNVDPINGDKDGVKLVEVGLTTQFRPVISKDRQSINLDSYAQIVQLAPTLDLKKAKDAPMFKCITFESNTDIPLGSAAIVAKRHTADTIVLMTIRPKAVKAKGK